MPTKAHLLRSDGLAGEVTKLRNDTEKGFENLETALGTTVVNATDSTDTYVLAPSGVVILLNNTGQDYFTGFILPDGVDGQTVRLVNGANYNPGNGLWASPRSTNSVGNDLYDIPPDGSVDLAWVTELGGWVATNYCGNVSENWD